MSKYIARYNLFAIIIFHFMSTASDIDNNLKLPNNGVYFLLVYVGPVTCGESTGCSNEKPELPLVSWRKRVHYSVMTFHFLR